MISNLNQDLVDILQNDTWMLEVLGILKKLELKDSWIGAGFIRNKIWDHKHNIEKTALNDIDVIYFDKTNLSPKKDLIIENELKQIKPSLSWSVKNQARMHIRNNQPPYLNCNNAITFWPETATAIAVRLNEHNKLDYIAPHGLEDLFNLIVKPTPNFDLKVYRQRIQKKQWNHTWHKLVFEEI